MDFEAGQYGRCPVANAISGQINIDQQTDAKNSFFIASPSVGGRIVEDYLFPKFRTNNSSRRRNMG